MCEVKNNGSICENRYFLSAGGYSCVCRFIAGVSLSILAIALLLKYRGRYFISPDAMD